MPSLLAFLPCEHAIISNEDQTVSLITLMQGVGAAIPDAQIGQDVLVPHKWCVYSFWHKERGDEGVAFEQQVELVAPSGAAVLSQVARFSFRADIPTHGQVGRISVVPIRKAVAGLSLYRLVLSIRREGEEFKKVSEFPFSVTVQAASEEPVSK